MLNIVKTNQKSAFNIKTSYQLLNIVNGLYMILYADLATKEHLDAVPVSEWK